MQRTQQTYAKAFEELISANQRISEQYCNETVEQIQRILDSNKKSFQLVDDMRPICEIQRARCDEIRALQTRRDPALREAYEKLGEIVGLLERCAELTNALRASAGGEYSISEQVRLLETYVSYCAELRRNARYANMQFVKQTVTEMHLQTKQTLQVVGKAFRKRLSEQCREFSRPFNVQLTAVLDSITQMLPIVSLTRQFDTGLYVEMKRLVTAQLYFFINGSVFHAFPAVFVPPRVQVPEYRGIAPCMRLNQLDYAVHGHLGDDAVQLSATEFTRFPRVIFDVVLAMLRVGAALGLAFPQAATRFMCVASEKFLYAPADVPAPDTLSELLGLVFSFLCAPPEALKCAGAAVALIGAAGQFNSGTLLQQTISALRRDSSAQNAQASPFTRKMQDFAHASALIALHCLGVLENASAVFSTLPCQMVAELCALYFAPARAGLETAVKEAVYRYIELLKAQKAQIYQTGVVQPTVVFAQFLNDCYVAYAHGSVQLGQASEYEEFYEFFAALEQMRALESNGNSGVTASASALYSPSLVMRNQRAAGLTTALAVDVPVAQALENAQSGKASQAAHLLPPTAPAQKTPENQLKATAPPPVRAVSAPFSGSYTQLPAVGSGLRIVDGVDSASRNASGAVYANVQRSGSRSGAGSGQGFGSAVQAVSGGFPGARSNVHLSSRGGVAINVSYAAASEVQAYASAFYARSLADFAGSSFGVNSGPVLGGAYHAVSGTDSAFGGYSATLSGISGAALSEVFCQSVYALLAAFYQQLDAFVQQNRGAAEKYGDVFRALNGEFVLAACAPLLQHRELGSAAGRLRTYTAAAARQYARAQLLHAMPWARFHDSITQILAQGFPRTVVQTRQGLTRAAAEQVIAEISANSQTEAQALFVRVRKQAAAAQYAMPRFAQQALQNALKTAKNALFDAIVAFAVETYQEFAAEILACYGNELKAFPPDTQIVKDALNAQRRVFVQTATGAGKSGAEREKPQGGYQARKNASD